VADDRADEAISKLRGTMERRLQSARTQIATAENQLQTAEAQLQSREQDQWISGAGSLFSAFFGGRNTVRSMASSISGISRRRAQVNTQQTRVDAGEHKLAERLARLDELEAELHDRVLGAQLEWADKASSIEALEVGVGRSGVEIDELVLVWVPVA
jgi:division protein CdvB (Snf7/Vps24/ESCRT-III family)